MTNDETELKRPKIQTTNSVSVMFLYPVFHRSSNLADVNFAVFTGNSINNAYLFRQVLLAVLGVILA